MINLKRKHMVKLFQFKKYVQGVSYKWWNGNVISFMWRLLFYRVLRTNIYVPRKLCQVQLFCIYLVKVYTWHLTIETSINLHVYLLIFQISSFKSKLWLYISQTIFRAMESSYMQNNRAGHSFLGTWNLFLETSYNGRTCMKLTKFPFHPFLWDAL